MTELPAYVEIGNDRRSYEIVLVEGLIDFGPCQALSHVDHAEQRILISDEVPAAGRAALLERAISAAMGLGALAFRMVPVRGKISTL